MARTAFIDESQRRNAYCLAAVTIEQAEITKVRQQLVAIARDGGRRRYHFTKESRQERLRLVRAFGELSTVAGIAVKVPPGMPPVDQRSLALASLVEKLARRVDRCVLDHVEPAQQARDRLVLRRTSASGRFNYSHELPSSPEPLLWIADAIAWCAGQPAWESRVAGWVEWIDP